MKADAIPSKFPKCPKHLTKDPQPRRSENATALTQKKIAEKRKEEERKRREVDDALPDLKDLRRRIDSRPWKKDASLSQLKCDVTDEFASFFKIEMNVEDLKPVIKYSVNLDKSLGFQCYHHDRRVPNVFFNNITKDGKVKKFSHVTKILKHLDDMKDEKGKEEIDLYIGRLKEYECTKFVRMDEITR